ncbi:MAG: protein kinase domain-containing protein [Chloroflexaceae bacterium]
MSATTQSAVAYAEPDDTTRPPSAATDLKGPSPALPPPSGSVTPRTSGSLSPGTTLGPGGRYRITGLIGQGGFAETFHALDTHLFDGPCVVKRLRMATSQSEETRAAVRASLIREAALLVALKTPGHPNIPEVYAYLADEYCLVMKYVEGISLQALLDRRSNGLPEDEALRYVYDTCSALAYLHARQTLHLDVKPANLLCDSSGRLWLIDFGIGRSTQAPGMALAGGTPGYSPPEQWYGRPEPRSDVYALGVTLFVLLTNRQPMNLAQAPSPTSLACALPPLRQVLPTVRPELEALVQRATDPDPTRRPSAAEMLDALRVLRTRMGVPRPTRPPDLGAIVGRTHQRDQVQAALARRGGCMIVGMPGVGKTALAVALTRQFGRPDHVFWHAFQPDERFESLLWHLAAFLAWNGHSDLWALLQRTGADRPPSHVLLDYLLGRLRGHPYLLCLDDFQHVETAPWMLRLLDQLEPLASAHGPRLIITTRHAVSLRWPGERVVLSGLERLAARELLVTSGLALPEDTADRLVVATEGNPQLLILAADALRRSGRPAEMIACLAETEDIERYLLQEVDSGCDEDERDVMRAIAALLGAPGHREVLEAMVGRRLRRSLRTLLDHHLIVVGETAQGHAYTQHAIVQSFYYSDMTSSERRELHQRAAAYFEREPADLLRAARQYVAAGDMQRAATLATRDIWGTVNQGQAGALLDLVAQLSSETFAADLRLQVYLARGELGTLLGEDATARASYEAAFALIPDLPDAAVRRSALAQVCRGMGELLEPQMPQQARDWIERGLQALGDEHPYESAALHLRSGSILIGLGDNEAARAAFEQGMAGLPPDALSGRADALTNLAIIAWMQGDTRTGVACSYEALDLYEHSGQRWKMITIRQNLGLGKQYAGDWVGAVAEFERALEAAHALGSIVRQSELALNLGVLAIYQGAPDIARAYLDGCTDLARQHRLHEQLSLALSSLADLHLRAGDWEAAWVALDEAAALVTSLDLRSQCSEIARLRAELLLDQGEIEAGLMQAEAACVYAREQGNPREAGMGLRVLGQALLASERVEPAMDTFAQSVTLLDDQDPYEAARTRMAWGAGHMDATGVALLRAAHTTFARLGARSDREMTRELLRARGEEDEEDEGEDAEAHGLDRVPAADHDDAGRHGNTIARGDESAIGAGICVCPRGSEHGE